MPTSALGDGVSLEAPVLPSELMSVVDPKARLRQQQQDLPLFPPLTSSWIVTQKVGDTPTPSAVKNAGSAGIFSQQPSLHGR